MKKTFSALLGIILVISLVAFGRPTSAAGPTTTELAEALVQLSNQERDLLSQGNYDSALAVAKMIENISERLQIEINLQKNRNAPTPRWRDGFPLPQIGSISASLDTTTPNSQNIVVNQTAVFAKIKLTAAGSTSGITSIQVGSDSANAGDSLKNIKIFEGNTQLGTTVPVLTNGGGNYYAWINVGISIPAGTSKVLTILATATGPSNPIRLGITGIKFNPPTARTSGIPVYGNPMTIAPAGFLIVGGDINRPISQNVAMGTSQVPFNSIKFTSANEGALIRSIKFAFSGSYPASPSALVAEKVCLYDGANQVGCTSVGADVAGMVIFNFAPGNEPRVPYPGNKVLTIKADISNYMDARSGDAISFDLNSPSDVTAVGVSSGQTINVLKETGESTGVVVTGNKMYLYRTVPTVSLSSSSPTGASCPDINGTVFKFDVTVPNYGFNIKLNEIKFTIHSYATAGTTVFNKLYKLYKSTDLSTPIAQAYSTANTIATDSTGWVVMYFDPGYEVSNNSITTFVLKADTSAMNQSPTVSEILQISIEDGDLYWDDSSGINANTGVRNLPINGTVLAY